MRRITLAFIVALGGCDNPFGPDVEFVNRRPMQPPAWYLDEYRATEDCLGVRGNVGAVRWFTAGDIRYNGRSVAGFWTPPHDITIHVAMVVNHETVRHESEHHIRQRGAEIHLPDGSTSCEYSRSAH